MEYSTEDSLKILLMERIVEIFPKEESVLLHLPESPLSYIVLPFVGCPYFCFFCHKNKWNSHL